MPFSVFLYTGFVRALPKEYEEAARVDGAASLRTFRSVVFPLLRPVTGTVAILTGLIIWNDFFLSLIFLNGTDKTPLPVAVYTFVGDVRVAVEPHLRGGDRLARADPRSSSSSPSGSSSAASPAVSRPEGIDGIRHLLGRRQDLSRTARAP